jgi:transposase
MVIKLASSTARNMMTFAHYRFKQYLKDRGQQAMCEVIEVSEAFTTKTCSYCGTQHKMGSKKRMKQGVEAGLRMWCGCRSKFKRLTTITKYFNIC